METMTTTTATTHDSETPAQRKARKIACALRTLALYRADIKQALSVQSRTASSLDDVELALAREQLRAQGELP